MQVLQGPGFSDIPTALIQGTWSLPHLRHAARTWAGQLRRVGVDLDLAPVVDTVPGPRRPAQPADRALRPRVRYTPRRVARHGWRSCAAWTTAASYPP